MSLKEVGLYFISIIVSIFSLLIGINTNLLGLVSNPSLEIGASIGISILIFLIGERITFNLTISKLEDNIPKHIKSTLNNLPQVNVIVEFSSSDEAMEYLCSRIENAKYIWNTKISKDSIPPARKVQIKYIRALKKALKNGLIYKDIVSPGFEDYAMELKNNYAGNYDYRIVDVKTNSFLNFILLTYNNKDEELIIGWVTSVLKGTEQKAYKIRDRRVIIYFKEYYQALYGG